MLGLGSTFAPRSQPATPPHFKQDGEFEPPARATPRPEADLCDIDELVPSKMSTEEFEARYLHLKRPAIIRGGAAASQAQFKYVACGTNRLN